MELSEALRTIDATAGFLMQLQALDNANLLVVEEEEGLGVLEAKVYTTINTSYPEHRCKFKYRSGGEIEFIIPQIAPVCDLIIDNWPSPSAQKLRSHIDESNVLYLADEILGLDDPMMYETVPEAYEYQALFKNAPSKLLYEIYDINYRLAYALRMTEREVNKDDENTSKTILDSIPDDLKTSEAKQIMQKLINGGIINDEWQPVDLSITERGYLAGEIACRLKIKNKWKVIGKLWDENSETLRQGNIKAAGQVRTGLFIEKLKRVLG